MTAPTLASTLAPAESTQVSPSQTAGINSTSNPSPSSSSQAFVTAVPSIQEKWMLEIEWPPQIRLGDSDVVRLSLIPSQNGYILSTEFPEHQAENSAIAVARMAGYALSASARLDASGFSLSPEGDLGQDLPPGSKVTWRWTLTPHSAGQQRISLQLMLRWTPLSGEISGVKARQLYSKAFTIRVIDLLGLSTQQAAAAGAGGLVLGSIFSLPIAWGLRKPKRVGLRRESPNTHLVIEHPPDIILSSEERTLLCALFSKYARILIEAQFRSGYSGARTFLILPVRADDRIDAYTIAKLGRSSSILREYENYEAFVKNTLPPITARIQELPVSLPAQSRRYQRSYPAENAGLRYTFIGEPGSTPVSLQQTLRRNPDPAFLEKLWDAFGPGWWMQRKPYAFRLAQEYDRMLPAHYVVEPASGKEAGGRSAGFLDGDLDPSAAVWKPGDVVHVRNFPSMELRADGKSYTLCGHTLPGRIPLRLRWMSPEPPAGNPVKVISTRALLLHDSVKGLETYGLPDPIARLPSLLAERIQGTQSIIHGDLNLENILVGPAGFFWLIDFSETREGHPLADFAHLGAEIIAHVIAPVVDSPADFVAYWKKQEPTPKQFLLLDMLQVLAQRCLFNPAQDREFRLAWMMACLGGLKYSNLDSHKRHLLFLSAALLGQGL